ncbi:MAG TPA: hypothetical protein VG498_08880 [Terriglobales bacterium]|nr:hypothetical protein [Terriglobales bacterium]
MRKFRLLVGSRIVPIQLAWGCVLLLPFVVVQTRAAESNRSSATLHIQVTVVPIVQMSMTTVLSESPAGAVTYDFQSKSNPVLTQQMTLRPLTTSEQSSATTSAHSNAADGSAVLETLTIVAK